MTFVNQRESKLATNSVKDGRYFFLFTVYLTILCALYTTYLDEYLDLTIKTTILFPVIIFPVIMLLFIGSHSKLRLFTFFNALHSNSRPLIWLLLFTAGPLQFFGFISGSKMDIEIDQPLSQYTLILSPFIVISGIAISSITGFSRAFRVAAGISILLTSSSILVDAVSPSTFSVYETRAAGFATNANKSSFGLIVLLAMAVRYRTLNSVDVALITISCFAVFFTFSRGGIFLLLLFLSYYIFCIFRGKSSISLVTLSLSLLFIIVFFYVANSYYSELKILEISGSIERLDRILLRKNLYESDDGRFQLLGYYWEIVKDSPFFGYGNGFSVRGMDTAPDSGAGPHNMYIRAWLDQGIGGLVIYAALLISSVMVFIHRKFDAGIALIFLMILQSFLSDIVINNKVLLLLLGFALGISAVQSATSLPRRPK